MADINVYPPIDPEYDKLKTRLKAMEEQELESSYNTYPAYYDKFPKFIRRFLIKRHLKKSVKTVGVKLSNDEVNIIKQTIVSRIPKALLKTKLAIYVHGSLAPKQKGIRTSKFGEEEPLLSDQFYISDIDIGILGEDIFTYIDDITNGIAIRKDGKLRDQATFRFCLNSFLTRREKGRGYNNLAPEWIKKVLEELDKKKFAGRYHRPINIIFYKNKEALSEEKATLLLNE